MFYKKNILFIFMLIVSFIFSLQFEGNARNKTWNSKYKYSTWSKKRYKKPVILKRNIQNIPRKKILPPKIIIESGTPFSSYKNEVNKGAIPLKDKNSLKRDILLLEQQLNMVNKEYYETRNKLESSIADISGLRKTLQEIKSQNMELKSSKKILSDIIWIIILTFSIIFFILILVLMNIFNKLKNKTIEFNKNFTLKEIQKDLNKNIDNLLHTKLTDFDEILEGNYKNFIDDTHENNAIRLKKFDESIENILQKNLRSLEPSDLPKYFKFNLGIGKDEKSLEFENTMSKFVHDKMEKYLKFLIRKEKLIIYNIQKTHLSINHFNSGNLLMKSYNYVDAIEEYKDAIRADNMFYGAYINLAKAFELNGQTDDAENIYKNAIKIKPYDYKAYFNYANLLANRNKYNDSIELYESAIELKPQYHKAYNNLGNAFRLLNRLEDAKEKYEKAILFNKDYAEAYFNLSLIERNLKNDKEELSDIAEKYIKKYNASEETEHLVKSLIINYSEDPFDKMYSGSNK